MAEKHLENSRDSCVSVAVGDKNEDVSMKPTSKRCTPPSPIPGPPHKSPRTDRPSPTIPTPDVEQLETDKTEISTETEERISPSARRKSWRRATITRRSLPALPNPYQALSRNICTSLPQQERLEKLMEASMKLAMERTQSMLQSAPNFSPESFQKQVEHIQNEWSSLAKSMNSQSYQLPSSIASSSEPTVQRAMEKLQKAISRLQDESESWERLLEKHQSKAKELERKVEQGQKTGVSLDLTSVAQSSQYQCIQSKPNYQDLLCRQKPMLHTMAMIMDNRCKVVRELLSVKEHSQLLVKNTSGRLAAEAGFEDLSSNHLRNLMAKPLPAATT